MPPAPAPSSTRSPLALDPALDGARIQAVQQPDETTLLLTTHRARHGAAHWLFSVGPERARFMRTFAGRAREGARRGAPPQFCQWLRTRLVGGRVSALVLRHPQLVQLSVRRGEETLHLLLELNRRDSNLLLLDAEEQLLIALRHPALPGRTLGPGQPYAPPPTLRPWPRGVQLSERYPAPDEAAARTLERTWQHREAAWALAERREPALATARRERKRLQRRLDKLAQDRAAGAEAALWQRRGELLQIHVARLRPGLTALEVPDVFEPGQPLVTIPLQPGAEPGENIARCFRAFRKARAAAPHVAQRLAETEAARAAWDDVLARLEAADHPAALDALARELPPAAATLAPLLRGATPKRGAQVQAPAGPLRRFSAEGYELLLGRSDAENDRVTFRIGHGRDWWLHAQGIPGSHVLVRNPGGDPLPPRTLREAAWLAAYYSQGRAAGRVEVDYTQRKHVRRPRGAAPGQVLYTHNKSLLVNLDDDLLRRVLQRTEPPAP